MAGVPPDVDRRFEANSKIVFRAFGHQRGRIV